MLGEDRTTTAYNDHGDQTEKVFEHHAREYSLDGEGRPSDAPTTESVDWSEARFRYDYDTHGNWVMQTVESRGETDQDFTLSSVEHRTLGYFE